jgi:sulfoxide reductase catalytic subunit YedY
MNITDNRIRMPRRQFTKILALGATRLALMGTPLAFMPGKGWAQTGKRMLPADTQMGSLIFEDPRFLDTSRLPITPLEQFGTMGPTDHETDLAHWQLTVDGSVAGSRTMTYAQIKALPGVQRDVLLICPGVFAYFARWRGISIRALLQEAGIDRRVNQVVVKGPAGPYRKVEEFAMSEIETDMVFLAYAVNGEDLPQKHGFPLRAVAEGHLGFQWVKYVDTVTAVIAEAPPDTSPPSTFREGFVP